VLGAHCPFGELAHVRLSSFPRIASEGFRGESGGKKGVMLRCEECDAMCEYAEGWLAYRIDDEDESEGPGYVAVYCPQCAEREFESVRRGSKGVAV
jgi:ribosomal protein L44E